MSNKSILQRNSKMTKTMKLHAGYRIFNVSMPAGITCPMAGACAKVCYAKYGRMAMPRQMAGYRENLDMYNAGTFFPQLEQELTRQERLAAKMGQTIMVRVHDTGDFFSREYLEDWLTFMRAHPTVWFYAYTKSVSFVKDAEISELIPENFTYVFSYGGRQDLLIDRQRDRFSEIVPEDADLPAGYFDGSEDDFIAADPGCRMIALRVHGQGKTYLEA